MKTVLAEYFNAKGKRLHAVLLEDDGRFASSPSDQTSNRQGAYALQAIISQVTTEQVGIHLARKVRSMSLAGKTPMSVSDAMATLETEFGTTSVQWARAIFTHLKLEPPSIQ